MGKLKPLLPDESQNFRTSFQFPVHWEVEIAQFAFNEVRDGTHDSPKVSEEGVPLVTSKNLINGVIDFSNTKTISFDDHEEISKRSGVQTGDLLFSMIGTIGNVAIVPEKTAFSVKNVGLFRKNNALLNSSYSFYWLMSRPYQKYLKDRQRGGNQKFVSLGVLRESPVPLPPLAEQKVIADKLNTLLAQVETSKARLERIPQILKTFRQSVLAAAVSGKLTEEWRGYNGASNVNLEQIAEQHKAYFIETRRKYNEPAEFKANSLTPKIPGNWRWFRAEQLCDLITKGTTPKKEHMTSSGDIPYIKVYNLTFDGTLDFSIEPTFIPKLVHDTELKRSKVFPGDVLMNIVGPPLGKVSIVPDSHEEWNINQAISIFRPVSGVTNEYLSICLRDEFLLELTKSKAKATAGQFNLTLEICRDYSIPVPPQEEQTEIVRRVEALFAFADGIEEKANAALERVNNLTQSILAKAFRGELTADWRAANPELISGENSAEALLKKIKAERAALRKRSEKKTATRKKA